MIQPLLNLSLLLRIGIQGFQLLFRVIFAGLGAVTQSIQLLADALQGSIGCCLGCQRPQIATHPGELLVSAHGISHILQGGSHRLCLTQLRAAGVQPLGLADLYIRVLQLFDLVIQQIQLIFFVFLVRRQCL